MYEMQCLIKDCHRISFLSHQNAVIAEEETKPEAAPLPQETIGSAFNCKFNLADNT
jgi:hypothetical protein